MACVMHKLLFRLCSLEACSYQNICGVIIVNELLHSSRNFVVLLMLFDVSPLYCHKGIFHNDVSGH